MSKLKSLAVIKEKVIEVDFPDIQGFVINIAYVPKDKIVEMRNKLKKIKFNKTTREREEVVDQEAFMKEYIREAVRGWKGLKIKHLPLLMVADISGHNPEEEIEYSEEEAEFLAGNSTIFDIFLSDTLNDLSLFSVTERETEEKNLKNSSAKASKAAE